ncbi:MAG TPA: hypothetical protein VNA68_02290 [Candidatus Dormibacteraeota bacterium]|nr:hypothetical protein [Candidatus Dormibacteraeota bacterium]
MTKKYMALLALLVIIYLGITFSIPPDPVSLAKYNLSVLQSRLLSLSIAVPVIGIWFAAFYGFSKFKSYAELIKSSPDGKAFVRLSSGIMVLAIGLPVSSILSSTLNYLGRQNHDLLPQVVITNNYISLLIAAVGFTLIAKGAADLAKVTKKALPSRSLVAIVVFLLLAAAYIYATLTNPNRTVPVIASGRATYFLPDWLILTTIITPYLYVWYKGLQAAFDINFYRKNIQGILYKKMLGYLAAGLTAVVVSSIFLQFLGAVSVALQKLSLAPLLIIIYILLMVIAVGYVLIALGAKQLKKIEEV